MDDLLEIKIMSSNTNQMSALFQSTGVPDEANFKLETTDSLKHCKLSAVDMISGQQFVGLSDKTSEYYIGVRNSNTLEIHPLSMFRMNPIIENSFPVLTPLTIKEQLDEFKEKFGSRKIQRSLASKRKYAIEFGEEDIEELESKTKSITETTVELATNERTINDSLDILPKQNRDAICVQEVYDLNEIITESERNVLKPLEDQLYQQIDNIFIKHLISDPNDSENKLIANYLHLLITLSNLKATDLRKADPLPTLMPEVKQILFVRFLTSQSMDRRIKYVFSPKQRDRVLIYGIILCLILNNYKPLEFESLQKAFKVPATKMRKIVEIIGTYIETLKNSLGVNTKSVVLRIPLNTFSEKKTFRRR